VFSRTPAPRPGWIGRALFASFLLLATVPPAGATSSRIRSLGGSGGYFEDDNNVLRWYGSIVDYADLAVAELGRFEDGQSTDEVSEQGGGLHVAFDLERRWGVAATYFSADQPNGIPGGSIEVLWGRAFGPFAPALYFKGTSYTRSEASNSHQLAGRSEFHHYWGAGVRWEISDHIYVDAAGDVHNTQFDYADLERDLRTGPSNSWDGWSARLRAFVRLSEKVVGVPLAEHVVDKRTTYSPTLDDAALLDAHTTRLGIGFNVLPDADNLVLVSAEYSEGRDDAVGYGSFGASFVAQDRDWFVLEGRVAAESLVLPWLTLRLGAVYRRIDNEIVLQTPAGDDDDAWATAREVAVVTPLTLGVGLHFGAFSADLVVNSEAPFGIGYALTGAGRESTTFTAITLSYGF
jgi:hypothetical protein